MGGIWPVMNQLVDLRTPIPVVSNMSYAEPDAPVLRCVRAFVRAWPNLTETTISGVHFIEADSPDEIGTASRSSCGRRARPSRTGSAIKGAVTCRFGNSRGRPESSILCRWLV
jgi:hypothetical protein